LLSKAQRKVDPGVVPDGATSPVIATSVSAVQEFAEIDPVGIMS
jgi:hypothetical protein